MAFLVGVLRRFRVLLALLVPPALVALLTMLGPFRIDPVAAWAGVGFRHRPGWLPGFASIDPNIGTTAFALGKRAALDLLSGRAPLWNHFEGLGAPLLGEMQSAALFPPTLLLLVPYGQALEHAVLQAVAGLGTYLFLRRFGLGTTAALAGGVLFEFNGVFAWLRNAVFNPVAFLPWLFYTIETLFCLVGVQARWAQRAPTIGLGAIAGALALYAGFPEVVYFYALLAAIWTALRAAGLPWRRSLVFGAELLMVAALAALISAPLLLAFADFLPQAAVGGHQGHEFRNHFLPPQAFLVALLPYVLGSISMAPQASIAAIWSDVGGYLGVTPLLLAVAGLACSWRRASSWVLALWVVLAVGASHGVPILHGAFLRLPLTAIAAYARYLDAGWIFACIVLGAVFLDRVEAGTVAERRRAVTIASVVVLLLLGIGAVFAAPVLTEVLAAGAGQRAYALLAFAAAAALFGLFLLAARQRTPRAALAGLAVLEAVVWFILPFASYPRSVRVDWALIDFLRGHAGLQRFAIASGSGLGPNFGSVFDIPSMNYDDLPVPARTARFVITRLDATNDGVIFGHNAPAANATERLEARSRFVAALDGYAQAGVRYVLSTEDLTAAQAYPLADGNAVAVPLQAGRAATVEIEAGATTRRITAVGILLGTYGGMADGSLRVEICQGMRCAAGRAPLAGAADNRNLLVALQAPVTVDPGPPLRLTIAKEGGQHDVALWMRPAADAGAHVGGVTAPAGALPVVVWFGPDDPLPILTTVTTTVFELPAARPYASAPGCLLEVGSQDRMTARCPAPSRLLRLEVAMDGWTARVNGIDAPIDPVEDTFQSVALPVGTSTVEFVYEPTGVRSSLPVALMTVAACLAAITSGFDRRTRRDPGPSVPR